MWKMRSLIEHICQTQNIFRNKMNVESLCGLYRRMTHYQGDLRHRCPIHNQLSCEVVSTGLGTEVQDISLLGKLLHPPPRGLASFVMLDKLNLSICTPIPAQDLLASGIERNGSHFPTFALYCHGRQMRSNARPFEILELIPS